MKSHEDSIILSDLNSIFLKKRRWLFKIPNNEAVVLLVSGGFDSVLLWGMLMDKYHLEVYPVSASIRPGEREALTFFSKEYASKYPDQFHQIVYKEYKWSDGFKISNEKLIAPIKVNNPQRMAIFSFIGYEYAFFLKQKYHINIYTILVGVMPEDVRYTYEGTLTCLRTINLNLCHIIQDYKWQFTGPVEEGFFIKKRDLLNYGISHDLPIDKTWSCDFNGFYQCGVCYSCVGRKKLFKKYDKTTYLNNLSSLKSMSLQKLNGLFSSFLFKNKHDKPENRGKKYKLVIQNNIEWKKSPNINKLFIFDKRSLLLHKFNESASFLWKVIVKGDATEQSLPLSLKQKYKLSEEQSKKDSNTFYLYCIKNRLIENLKN